MVAYDLTGGGTNVMCDTCVDRYKLDVTLIGSGKPNNRRL